VCPAHHISKLPYLWSENCKRKLLDRNSTKALEKRLTQLAIAFLPSVLPPVVLPRAQILMAGALATTF
jgi:hypothetical protein